MERRERGGREERERRERDFLFGNDF